ncbi:MAG TPA: hypothetical protein DCZ97_11965, partial [Syntrophus sp. (in: bacteria)]|nr:hypothetical protein [Syntrophus sp. (in: bacteria)]
MKRSLFLFIWFIITLTAPLVHASEAAKPSGQVTSLSEILVLNSYHPGYAWSDDEQAGVIDVLRAKDKNGVPVVECLDLKRLPDGKHLAELKKLFRLKYRNKKFSVVIAMDNPALEFAIDSREELFGNAPIVFCGINNYTPALLKGRSDVTGIAESIDLAGTIEVMLRLHPDTREIFSPHDDTATGLAVRKELEALAPRFAKVRFRFNDPLSMEELLKELKRLPKDSLVLEIGFITDKSGRTFGISETTKLFYEHSPVPIYSTYEQRLGFGIVGGKLLNPQIHGTNAGRVALRVLAGEKASTIPIVFDSDSQFMFDYKVLSRFGIPLSALPEGSTVINKPVSFYAAHREVILTASGIIGFLSIIIVLLIINTIQRKRSSEVIRRKDELFKVITSSNPDYILIQDNELRYSFVMNPQLGLTEQDMIGKTDHGFLSKEDADALTEIKRQVLKTGQPVHVEVPLISSKGEKEFFDGSYIPKCDEKGQIDGLIGYFRNVTERKRAEEDIRRMALMLDTAPNSVTVHDFDGRFLYANQRTLDLHGFNRDEFLAINLHQLDAPDSEKLIAPRMQELLNRGEAIFEVAHSRKDGSTLPLEVSARITTWGDKKVILSVATDLTDRKQTENTLRESEERLRFHTDNSPMAVIEWNADFIITRWTGAAEKVFGWSFEETIGKPIMELLMIYEEDIPIVQSVMQRLTDGKSKQVVSSNRNYTKKGEVIQCEWYNSVLYDSAGKMISVMSQVLDITERKRAEEEKHRLEERSRKIVEDIFRFIPEGVLVFSRKRELLRQNEAFRELASGYAKRLGFAEDELENLIVDKIKAAMGDKNIKEIRISMKHETGEQTFDGFEELVLELDMARILFAEEEKARIVISIKDITERKMMEESERRNREVAERLALETAIIAEIGRVVGSILNINKVYKLVATETRKLIPYDRLLVNRVKKGDDRFIVAFFSGIGNPKRRVGDLYPCKGTTTGVVMRTRSGILVQPDDAEEIKDLYPNLYETFKAGLRSTMSVPLISMGEVIGSMNFRSKKLKAYTEHDLRLAERIGMQVAGAIVNAELFNDLDKMEKSLRESEENFRRS